MRLRVGLDYWRLALWASMGLTLDSCGGTSEQTLPVALTCKNSTPIAVRGQFLSGTESCDNGLTHRHSADACPYVPRSEPIVHLSPEQMRDPYFREPYPCISDADCAEKPRGFCKLDYNARSSCQYGCERDADCAIGQVCLCEDPAGLCVEAQCHTDSDCEQTGICAVYAEGGCLSTKRLVCQTNRDTCAVDTDCPNHAECAHNGDHRACEEDRLVCGRPFLVAQTVRVAKLAKRDDWLLEMTPDTSALTRLDRERIAAHWLTAAVMEHASIAAFARFTLQLMALGAPSRLIEASQTATGDELAHARACFSLARAYSGIEQGPGPLDVSGCVDETELVDIVRTAFREGCIAETQAAVEAARARDLCTDAAVRAVLTRISEDEFRHAQLAWRFVQWATARNSRIREVLERELDLAVSQVGVAIRQTNDEDGVAALEAHGCLTPSERRLVAHDTLLSVVKPTLHALFRSTRDRTDSEVYQDVSAF